MKIFKTSLPVLICSLSLLSPSQSQASFKSQICTSKNPEAELIRAYKLESIHQDFSNLKQITKEHPPTDADIMKDELLGAFTKFQEQTLELVERDQLFRKLPTNHQTWLNTYLNEYLEAYNAANLQVGFDIIDLNLPPEEQPAKRQELIGIARQELLEEYRPKILKILNLTNSLSPSEEEFLITWTLEFIPNEPTYVWTESATRLHRYLWDLIYEYEPIKNTGKFASGSYWVETHTASLAPGLNLNAAARIEKDSSKNANIRFRLSPFQDKIETFICDFSKNPNSCALQNLEAWCSEFNS